MPSAQEEVRKILPGFYVHPCPLGSRGDPFPLNSTLSPWLLPLGTGTPGLERGCTEALRCPQQMARPWPAGAQGWRVLDGCSLPRSQQVLPRGPGCAGHGDTGAVTTGKMDLQTKTSSVCVRKHSLGMAQQEGRGKS